MWTEFTDSQLQDPDTREANSILRACVHCGFCTATCPTYVLLGDELDGPRGRIYMIKDMLEKGGPPGAEVVKHIDRCLSCLSCMTTCPSGVHYQHLVDHARRHIERTYRRPLRDRLLRRLLATVLPRPGLFRVALWGARLTRPFAALIPVWMQPMLRLAPRTVPAGSPVDRPQVLPALGERRRRVALFTGCAQQVLAPTINEATARLLTRHGCEVVVVEGAGCCGALAHHIGLDDPAIASARANVAAWVREIEGAGLDAIVINASGCGTQIKDYRFLLREDSHWAGAAARVSSLARDVTELMMELGVQPKTGSGEGLVVAYQSACSKQHGQGICHEPVALLAAAGFSVRELPEGHLCCGSAGTYNILQPELATRLRDRKLGHIEALAPDAIASGNIGCMTQLAGATELPVLHTVELLDWATGGPRPAALGAAR